VKALSAAGYKVALTTYPRVKHDISPDMKAAFTKHISAALN
jgi:hypothetical protein